ncbi:hypothetical protein OF83DRAFT_1051645 [Amylostereum chailletii]|nr:hypothetical protein OF83DRAFT_1051645 [Amylostereum chailletii]
MHAAGLNITDHMQKLLRGLVPCDTKNGDNKDSWRRWMCLTGDAWERHGALVVAARSYLPSSIERPPRNPCRKSSSGYKCLEFLVWIYVLAPALLFGVLEFSLWQHFCKLVMGIRIVFQRQATQVELERAHQLLADFKYDLEVKYAECKISRMHFMPQCTHAITHFPFSYTRIGPCICSSQFPIERTIGDLGAEIKPHSNPFANLAQRALRRAQVNCLKALYPEFSDASDIAPSQAPSCILEGGYVLLHPRDNRPREVRDAEALAIRAYLRSTIGPDAGEASWHDKQEAVRKWSRCRLPNREVGRSRMRETGGRRITRISRNVKFHTPNGFGYAEVLYYFQWKIASAVRALALVSKYGDPDPFLLASSFGAVWAAPALGDLGLAVIEVSSIVAVVGMVPHKFRTEHTNGIEVELYFVAEKLGAEIEFLDSRDDDEDREDEEDTDEDDDDDEE